MLVPESTKVMLSTLPRISVTIAVAVCADAGATDTTGGLFMLYPKPQSSLERVRPARVVSGFIFATGEGLRKEAGPSVPPLSTEILLKPTVLALTWTFVLLKVKLLPITGLPVTGLSI